MYVCRSVKFVFFGEEEEEEEGGGHLLRAPASLLVCNVFPRNTVVK